jgi:ATP-dependent exoDNAse (exonuclease V) alpha subunit
MNTDEHGCTPAPITAKRFVPEKKPSRWSAEELAKMEEPIDEGNRFLAHAHAGRNVFLTGMAGTGKSTLLEAFVDSAVQDVDVTAPTGVAALNVGGMTLHRFCGMRLGPKPKQNDVEFYRELKEERHPAIQAGFRRVRNCEVLVIDEVSMLPGRVLNFVDFLFRTERYCDEPFGGCQVIATGDFLQLPPVRTSDKEPHDWAFASRAWQEAEFRTIALEKVRRQDEPDFVRALGNFRRGRIWGEDARLLQCRIRSFPPANLTRLFTHNAQVDRWNAFQLSELPGEPVVLESQTEGPPQQVEFLRKNLLTPSRLELKPGGLVMFTINRNEPGSVEKGEYEPGRELYVNGELGVVREIDQRGEVIRVLKKSGEEIPVTPFTWRFDRNDQESAKLTQYPLRLAYAMTIHKAQGLTLDAAYLDIRAAREPGQAYVAVSRVRSLAGLHFKDWFKGVWVSEEALKFYEAEGRPSRVN